MSKQQDKQDITSTAGDSMLNNTLFYVMGHCSVLSNCFALLFDYQ
jgi:hypothetical protein